MTSKDFFGNKGKEPHVNTEVKRVMSTDVVVGRALLSSTFIFPHCSYKGRRNLQVKKTDKKEVESDWQGGI